MISDGWRHRRNVGWVVVMLSSDGSLNKGVIHWYVPGWTVEPISTGVCPRADSWESLTRARLQSCLVTRPQGGWNHYMQLRSFGVSGVDRRTGFLRRKLELIKGVSQTKLGVSIGPHGPRTLLIGWNIFNFDWLYNCATFLIGAGRRGITQLHG